MIVIVSMALLAVSTQVGTASAALFTNGGFETGDFTGWTLSNGANDGFTFVVTNSGYQNLPPNPGSFEAQMGTFGNAGQISQAFDTAAGQEYKVSFWLKNDSKDSTNVFQVLWNGAVQNLNPVLNPTLASPYTQYQFTTTAANASSEIAFSFLNDPSIYHLDNVDVTPTPIPAAFWLLGSGLAGLAGLRRKKA